MGMAAVQASASALGSQLSAPPAVLQQRKFRGHAFSWEASPLGSKGKFVQDKSKRSKIFFL